MSETPRPNPATPDNPIRKTTPRRKVLGMLGVGALGALALKYDSALSLLSGGEYEKYTEQAKNFLNNVYGLQVEHGPSKDKTIVGDPLNKYELARGLELVIEEASKYPPDFFKNNGVASIRFLNNVKVDGLEYTGGYAGLEGEIGIAYDASFFERLKGYARGVFHHELFHILDYKDGGYKKDDDDWRAIQGGGCQVYREVGGREDSFRFATSPIEWFINEYGQRNPVEDRAMFAQVLMNPQLHDQLLKRINQSNDQQTKEILQTKYENIISNYEKWSKGKMGKQYWQDIRANKVASNYFRKAA